MPKNRPLIWRTWIGPSQRAFIEAIAAPMGAAASDGRPVSAAKLIGRADEKFTRHARTHAFLEGGDAREVHILPGVLPNARSSRGYDESRSAGPDVLVLLPLGIVHRLGNRGLRTPSWSDLSPKRARHWHKPVMVVGMKDHCLNDLALLRETFRL